MLWESQVYARKLRHDNIGPVYICHGKGGRHSDDTAASSVCSLFASGRIFDHQAGMGLQSQQRGGFQIALWMELAQTHLRSRDKGWWTGQADCL